MDFAQVLHVRAVDVYYRGADASVSQADWERQWKDPYNLCDEALKHLGPEFEQLHRPVAQAITRYEITMAFFTE